MKDALAIILVFFFVLLWHLSPYAIYTIPLLGFCTIAYLITTFQHNKRKTTSTKRLTVLLLTACCLLLIFVTGGLNSFLFLLIYLLSFAVTTLLEPGTISIFVLAAIIIFIPDALHGDMLSNIVKLGSLVLIAPIAYFFGMFIRIREQEVKQTKIVTEQIMADVSEIVVHEGEIMETSDLEKLHDIVEQTRRLEKQL